MVSHSRWIKCGWKARGTGVNVWKLATFILLIGLDPAARGYVFENSIWPSGVVTVHLHLGWLAEPLYDGQASWNAAIQPAFDAWNSHLCSLQLESELPYSSAHPRSLDSKNQVYWSLKVNGRPFGDALAVTLKWYVGSRTKEADVLLNTSIYWDSYRGALRDHRECESSYPYACHQIYDVQRVVEHELGHVLGLGHPDAAGKNVEALMNSRVSDLNHLTEDDIAGIQALYRPERTKPTVKINYPAQSAAVSNEWISASGSAADNGEVVEVWCQLNDGPFEPAEQTENWSAELHLALGTNTLRVKSIDLCGNESIMARRTFTYVQLTKLIVLTTGIGSISPDLNEKNLAVNLGYTLTARPGPGSLFSNWTGDGILGTHPRLTFLMRSNLIVRANFVRNPFPAVQGTYRGLFHPAEGIDFPHSGQFKLATTGRGAVIGSLYSGRSRIGMRGQLDLSGQARITVPVRGQSSYEIDLLLDLASPTGQITGSIRKDDWTADLLGYRAEFSARANPCPYAGRYTMVFPNDSQDEEMPAQGTGYGTVRVTASGRVMWMGALGDGTRISQGTTVGRQGEWALYNSLYRGSGILMGWIYFNHADGSIPEGDLSWIKEGDPDADPSSPGFNYALVVFGSRYHQPDAGQSVLANFDDGEVVFSGGDLMSSTVCPVMVDERNRVINLGQGELTFKISVASGAFRGSFQDPAWAQSVGFRGVLLQDQGIGLGFFIGQSRNGQVYLEPAP